MYMNTKLMIALRDHTADNYLENQDMKEYFREQPLGKLALPTGKIIANDPLCLFETEPFVKSVPPGNYPVMLYIYHCNTDQRVAFAEIRFSENMPVKYEPAITAEQDAATLERDEFFGYGVDSGTGCFMDEQACQKLLQLTDDLEDGILPEFNQKLEKSYIDTYCAANYTLPGIKCNVAAFSTGYGDGAYPSYWGYDKSGKVCCLITDFCIIEEVNVD